MSNHMFLTGSLQPRRWWPKQVFQAKRLCFPDHNYVRDHKHSMVTRERQKTEHEDATWGNVQLELRCGFSDTTSAISYSGGWESGDVLCGWRRHSCIARVCYAAAEHVEKTRGAVCNLISYHSDVTVSVSRGRGLTLKRKEVTELSPVDLCRLHLFSAWCSRDDRASRGL